MADWKALAQGIEQGWKMGQGMSERKGRQLYGDVMTGTGAANQSFSGGIPMPGQPGMEGQPQTNEARYEGPTIQGQMEMLAEALARNGIDTDQFHAGVQNIGMRSYNNVKRASDDFNNAADPQVKQRALQEILYSIPGAGMNYVVAQEDGTFATVPHDEDGNPLPPDKAQGLVLTPEMVNSMVLEATQDPDKWFQMVGMSTMDLAELRYKNAQTAASEGGERRAEELHPYNIDTEKAKALKERAAAAKSASGSSGDMEAHQLSKAIADWKKSQIDLLEQNLSTVYDPEERQRQFQQGAAAIEAEAVRKYQRAEAGDSGFSILAGGQPTRSAGGKVAASVAAPAGAIKNEDGTVSDAEGNVIGRWK